ncbi:MAG: hypothetical protein ACE5FN_11245 [Leptospirillia bacterium]
MERIRKKWHRLKQGERILFFTVAVMAVFGVFFWIAALTGVSDILRVRDIYEESPEANIGYEIVRKRGCRNCHNILKIGEWGLAPGLDGEGSRRTYAWIRAYLEDPARQMQGKTLHDGKYAEDFSDMSEREKNFIATFLFAQKSMPGSSNYSKPPE